MLRRTLSTLLCLLALAGLAAGGAAAAKAPATLSESVPYAPMPCIGAQPFAGTIQSQETIGKSRIKLHKGQLEVEASWNVAFAYRPDPAAAPTYVGMQKVEVDTVVPGVEAVTNEAPVTLDVPVTVPVVGPNGEASSVSAVATLFFYPDKGKRIAFTIVDSDWSCA